MLFRVMIEPGQEKHAEAFVNDHFNGAEFNIDEYEDRESGGAIKAYVSVPVRLVRDLTDEAERTMQESGLFMDVRLYDAPMTPPATSAAWIIPAAPNALTSPIPLTPCVHPGMWRP